MALRPDWRADNTWHIPRLIRKAARGGADWNLKRKTKLCREGINPATLANKNARLNILKRVTRSAGCGRRKQRSELGPPSTRKAAGGRKAVRAALGREAVRRAPRGKRAETVQRNEQTKHSTNQNYADDFINSVGSIAGGGSSGVAVQS